MVNGITVFNIREYLSVKDDQELGEEALRELLSEFSCIKNADVERFLKEQSIEFFVRYIRFNGYYLLIYIILEFKSNIWLV